MASNTIYELDMANLFCGDEDPSRSQFLTLENVKLPTLTEKTKDHMPGGGVIGLKIGMRSFEPLSMTFKLRGLNPDVMNKFGVNGNARRKYTFRGNVRDLAEGINLKAEGIITGRLVKVDQGEFSRDEGVSNDYEVAEIVGYQFILDGKEKVYFDYFAGPIGWRVDGVSEFAEEARNLGLA